VRRSRSETTTNEPTDRQTSYNFVSASTNCSNILSSIADACRGHFEGERVKTPFPLLRCLTTHYGRHCKPFSGQRCTRLQDVKCTVSIFFSESDNMDTRRSVLGAWIEATISAWLASVPTVPVLRNDRCCPDLTSVHDSIDS